MRNILLGIVLSFALCVVFSCSMSETQKNVQYAAEFKSNIDKFEEKHTGMTKSLSETVDKTVNQLSDETKPTKEKLADVSQDWEVSWNDILNEYESLTEYYGKIGTSSSQYFQKIDQVTQEIKDNSIRDQEMKRNKGQRKEWDNAYNQAEVNLKEIGKLLEDGNDFQRLLVLAAMRQQIYNRIEELKQISISAQELFRRLESFTETGRQLLNYDNA